MLIAIASKENLSGLSVSSKFSLWLLVVVFTYTKKFAPKIIQCTNVANRRFDFYAKIFLAFFITIQFVHFGLQFLLIMANPDIIFTVPASREFSVHICWYT